MNEIIDKERDIRVRGEIYTEIPEDLFIPPDALRIILEEFEGPLDLLLYLIKKQNIDIVDIVLVIDISSSMLATDFKPNRLEVVKKTAKNFISKRDGDRLGILVFAGESFIQCPLTIDKDVLLSLMDEVSVAQQSYDGTAIGMAIANATNRLRNSASKSKVMILLSDGSNNSGELDPTTAADLAKQFNIKIYTIGAGTNDDVSFIPGRGYIRNEIDEKSLIAIAKTAIIPPIARLPVSPINT